MPGCWLVGQGRPKTALEWRACWVVDLAQGQRLCSEPQHLHATRFLCWRASRTNQTVRDVALPWLAMTAFGHLGLVCSLCRMSPPLGRTSQAPDCRVLAGCGLIFHYAGASHGPAAPGEVLAVRSVRKPEPALLLPAKRAHAFLSPPNYDLYFDQSAGALMIPSILTGSLSLMTLTPKFASVSPRLQASTLNRVAAHPQEYQTGPGTSHWAVGQLPRAAPKILVHLAMAPPWRPRNQTASTGPNLWVTASRIAREF
jgi:hypothetical protein